MAQNGVALSKFGRALMPFLLCLMAIGKAQGTSETELSSKYGVEVLTDLEQTATDGYFVGAAGVNIHYIEVIPPEPKGVIIISPGQTEPALKYAELIYDLKDLGYAFFAIDHRGQGLSGRLAADPRKSHVDAFKNYVDDFATFVNQIVKPGNYRKSILLAHSMGGAIAAGYLAKFPKTVTGAVLSAPMFQINTGAAPEIVAGWATSFGRFLSAQALAPGQVLFSRPMRFEGNPVTSSRERFATANELLEKHPELGIGGATTQWVSESIRFTSAIRSTENVFQIPTLIFQAMADQLVLPQGQNQICRLSPGYCELIQVPEAGHEIFMEKDAIREPVLEKIREFLR